ncbi:MBL fold metallo-hydrolase [bacterium]|nr:MBL fold metallo-hydrolase [bacterium]
MKKFTIIFIMLSLCSLCFGQDQYTVEVVKLTDKLYKITADGGYPVNFVAFIGEDGLLLVDAGFKSTARKLKAALKKLGNDMPTYIISTHEHIDHVGGNFIFGKDPIIIGHKNLRKRMRCDNYILEEYPEYALPEITFTDSMSVYFNGEEIRIISIIGGHTDNDIMVHFTKSGYAYLGDDAYGMHIPSWDILSGNCSKYASAVKKAIDLLPNDTKFISGHGRDLSMAEMREWQKMLEETTEVIRIEMGKGKDVESMQNEKILSKWEKCTEGGYVSTNTWIQWVFNGIKGEESTLKSTTADYYRAYHNGGIEAIKTTYYELKKDKTWDDNLNPSELYTFAGFLLSKDKIAETIKLFQFAISEYPDIYYFYDGLGEAFWTKGDKENAIKFYKKSLEILPENTNATMMLEIITNE